MKRYEYVETLDESVLSDFLIKIYTKRIQHLISEEDEKPEQEQKIKEFMDEKIAYAYYCSYIAIFRQMNEEFSQRVAKVLQYEDYDLYKKAINSNIVIPELEQKIIENEEELTKEFEYTEDE